MTDEMLDLARANAAKAGATNVEFLKGTIEDIPLPDASVDVVISNCVINLSTDKPAVLAEMFRVLAPGGRIGICDVVAEDHLTADERAERGSYVGCIAGALSRASTSTAWPPPGSPTPTVEFTHEVADRMHGAIIRATKPADGPRGDRTATAQLRSVRRRPAARRRRRPTAATPATPRPPCRPAAAAADERHHARDARHRPGPRRLSVLDRWLPAWILLAMVVGLLLGRFVPGLADALDAVKVGSVSLPIAIGLLVMMYPVLAKVRYDETGHVAGDTPPADHLAGAQLGRRPGADVRAGLAVAARPAGVPHRADHRRPGPLHRHGADLERPGLRRPRGRRRAGRDQLRLPGRSRSAPLGWFYLQVLPGWLGLPTTVGRVLHRAPIAVSVLVFLGIPLLAGFLTRDLGETAQGPRLVREHVPARSSARGALYGLLFTIVLLFALQGDTITDRAAGRGPDRAAAAGLLRAHVRHRHVAGRAPRPRLPADHDAGVHRRRQQLRARHRGRDRRPSASPPGRPWPVSSAR